MSQRYFTFSMLYIALMFLSFPASAATPRYDFSFEEPLVIAADRGNIHEITRLLKNGAKVNKQDKFGVTPLMRAVVRGNSEVVKVLLDAGADVHIKDIGGATALHIASRLGHKTISDMLLKNGANPNATDTHGYTPLERAIKSEREGIVQSLISEGAILTQKGQGGLTPSELAFQGNNKKIQQIFNGTKPVVVAETPKVVTAVQIDEPIKQDTKDAGVLVVKTEEKTLDTPEEKKKNIIVVTTPEVVSTVHRDNLNEQDEKQTNILGALKTSHPAHALSEQKVVHHAEPIAHPAEENIAPLHPISENEPVNEQSFDILAWFNNLENPLATKESSDPLEQEVAYTIAENDPLIGPGIATNSIPAIEPEQDIIITQSILAPEVVLHTPKPTQENAMTVTDSTIATTTKNLRESTATKNLNNKELMVQAREVPDNFQASNVHNNATPVPATHHVEIGTFSSNAEAKKFVNAKLPQHATQTEITAAANNSFKVTVKGLNESNANSLCTTLASSNSTMNCNVLSKLNTVSDASFHLY